MFYNTSARCPLQGGSSDEGRKANSV